MQTFDPVLWRSRASRRFAKASAKGSRGCAEKYLRDIENVEKLDTLIAWCTSKKLTVTFTKMFGGMLDVGAKAISCSGRLSPETQLYVILHECGHFLIGSAEPHERFGNGYGTTNPSVKRSTAHKIDIIDEELEAWARGKKLAKRLKIIINDARYTKTRSEYIKTYMKWALKVDGYGKPEKDSDENE